MFYLLLDLVNQMKIKLTDLEQTLTMMLKTNTNLQSLGIFL